MAYCVPCWAEPVMSPLFAWAILTSVAPFFVYIVLFYWLATLGFIVGVPNWFFHSSQFVPPGVGDVLAESSKCIESGGLSWESLSPHFQSPKYPSPALPERRSCRCWVLCWGLRVIWWQQEPHSIALAPEVSGLCWSLARGCQALELFSANGVSSQPPREEPPSLCTWLAEPCLLLLALYSCPSHSPQLGGLSRAVFSLCSCGSLN